MSDRRDPPRRPNDRHETADPIQSPGELAKRRATSVRVRILTRTQNPTEWEAAIRSLGLTPEEWEQLPPSCPQESPEKPTEPSHLELFPGFQSPSDESRRKAQAGDSRHLPAGTRRELLPENNDPLNLVAKEKLAQVAKPEAGLLYVLQLIDWALVRGELTWPPVPHVRESGRLFLDALLYADSAKAWAWLIDLGLSPEENAHMGLDPGALQCLDPVDVAAHLLQAFSWRVIEETSEGMDVMPEY